MSEAQVSGMMLLWWRRLADEDGSAPLASELLPQQRGSVVQTSRTVGLVTFTNLP